MASKVRPDDPAGVALLRRVGGRVIQTCPGLRPDPCTAEVIAWCEAVRPPGDVVVRPLSDIAPEARPQLWVEQYVWVHQRWAAVDRGGLESLAELMAGPADPTASSVALRAGVVEAIGWTFAEDDATYGIVAETARRDTADGAALVASVLSRCLLRLAEQRCHVVEIDGHDGDPHLAPVLATMPPCAAAPLWLVTVA